MAGILSPTDNVLNLPLFLPPKFYAECRFVDRKDILVMGGGLWPWADLQFSNSLKIHFEEQGFEVQSALYEPIKRTFILRVIVKHRIIPN